MSPLITDAENAELEKIGATFAHEATECLCRSVAKVVETFAVAVGVPVTPDLRQSLSRRMFVSLIKVLADEIAKE